MVEKSKGGSVTETTQAPALTEGRRGEIEKMLAELILLSAAIVALKRTPLSQTERARRLTPILARREALETVLFG